MRRREEEQEEGEGRGETRMEDVRRQLKRRSFPLLRLEDSPGAPDLDDLDPGLDPEPAAEPVEAPEPDPLDAPRTPGVSERRCSGPDSDSLDPSYDPMAPASPPAPPAPMLPARVRSYSASWSAGVREYVSAFLFAGSDEHRRCQLERVAL
eukprot:8463235-Pyramimonas_sp.AAC.1